MVFWSSIKVEIWLFFWNFNFVLWRMKFVSFFSCLSIVVIDISFAEHPFVFQYFTYWDPWIVVWVEYCHDQILGLRGYFHWKTVGWENKLASFIENVLSLRKDILGLELKSQSFKALTLKNSHCLFFHFNLSLCLSLSCIPNPNQ